MPPVVSVKVWGEFALFARPELKVERVSYPVMTPSSARGVLDAILYKPQMAWHVRRIKVLRAELPPGFPAGEAERPYRLTGIRRNEIQGKIAPRTVEGWIKEPATFEPYLVDSAGREGAQGQNRTQRNSLVLHHVAYVIEASVKLTAKANQARKRPEEGDDTGPDTEAKYVSMFNRRVAKGQCFHRPYLGIREFAANFAPATGKEQPISWTENLGYMLYDIRFDGVGGNQPGFFQANVREGVLNCDTDGADAVTVLGWEEPEEVAS